MSDSDVGMWDESTAKEWSRVVDTFIVADTPDEAITPMNGIIKTWASVRLMHQFMPIIGWLRNINSRNRERNKQIAELDARIKALEQRPGSTGVKWAGIWAPSKTYSEGSLVTRSGRLVVGNYGYRERSGRDEC